MSGALEALLKFLTEYSWRAFFGVFIASGVILFFPDQLKIVDWARPFRGYLITALIVSGVVLATYVVSTVQTYLRDRSEGRVDLRMVPITPLVATWSVGATPSPSKKEPMMIVICQIHFAHGENTSVHLKRGYLKGTKEAFPMGEIIVDGAYGELPESICVGVTPLKAKPGKEFTGRLVFVDQFNEKHTSEKITFRPNTIPSNIIENQLRSSPNCVFCNQPVTLEDQAKEAQMTAHTTCI